jgi:nickel transport protein
MAYCDVSVFAPGGESDPYQQGTSDRNGCFAFLPDTNGTWTVTVDDAMGHAVKAHVEIGSAGMRSRGRGPQASRLGGAVIGISAIFGIFGLYAILATRSGRYRQARGRKA